MDLATWQLIEQLKAWHATTEDPDEHARIAFLVVKIMEEAGEVAQALIGATSQNPRKGRQTHTMDDVARELCDVALAALEALATVTDDPAAFFTAHVAGIGERAEREGAPCSKA